MASIVTSARPLDEDIEDFEMRCRINPERDPHLNADGSSKAAEDKRPLLDRYEVRLNGGIEYSDDPDLRVDKVVSWIPLDDATFTTPLWTPGDAAQLRILMAKFHEYWRSRVV